MITAAIVCGTLGALWWRAERLLDRWLALRERAAVAATTPPSKMQIPLDLAMRVDEESEPWAREHLRSMVRESYEELGDWAAVRQKMGMAA